MALVVAVGLVGAGCEPPRCVPPYPAAAGQQTYPEPAGSWPIDGAIVPWTAVLDSDGDGTADTFELSDDLRELVVHRSSGDLTLSVGPSEQLWTNHPGMLALGDLDGDGRTDLGMTVSDGTTARHVVVRGGIEDGAYAVDAVGVATLPLAGEDLPSPQPAGDVDADGRDDVMVITRTSTQVWSGRDLDLVAPAPVAPPAYQLDRTASASAVQLTPTRNALVLLEESTSGGETVVTLTLWSDGVEMAFTTQDGEIPVTAPLFFTSAAIVVDGDQRWLTLSMNYRNLHEQWAWDLDDLCAAAG